MNSNALTQRDPRDYIGTARLVVDEAYNLAATDIMDCLDVSRNYFESHIKENIKNVWISQKTANFLLRTHGINVPKSFRYSRDSFYDWFNRHIEVSRQTIEVNLFDYVTDANRFKDEMEQFRETANKSLNPNAEKEQVYREELSKKGGRLLDERISFIRRNRVEAILLDETIDPLHTDMVRPATISQTPEQAYRYAFKHGLIKVVLNGELTYFIRTNPVQKVFYGCTVPYSAYLNIIK